MAKNVINLINRLLNKNRKHQDSTPLITESIETRNREAEDILQNAIYDVISFNYDVVRNNIEYVYTRGGKQIEDLKCLKSDVATPISYAVDGNVYNVRRNGLVHEDGTPDSNDLIIRVPKPSKKKGYVITYTYPNQEYFTVYDIIFKSREDAEKYRLPDKDGRYVRQFYSAECKEIHEITLTIDSVPKSIRQLVNKKNI